MSIYRNNKIKLNSTNQDMVLQVIDWKTYDEEIDEDSSGDSNSDESGEDENKVPMTEYTISLFGLTLNNESVSVKVNGFPPHFYIQIPENWKKYHIEEMVEEIKRKLSFKSKTYGKSVLRYMVTKKKIFKGFTNNKFYPFVRILFRNKKTMDMCSKLFLDKNNRPKKFKIENLRDSMYGRKFPVFETNIDPMLRFMHTREIQPANFIRIEKNKYEISNPLETHCQMEIKTKWSNISGVPSEDISKLIVLSYDIEADSSHGDFPVAKKKYKKLATNVVDYYLNILKNSKKEKNKTEKDSLKKILSKLDELFMSCISSGFEEVENKYEVSYVYTKDNEKPKKNAIKITAKEMIPIVKNDKGVLITSGKYADKHGIIVNEDKEDKNYTIELIDELDKKTVWEDGVKKEIDDETFSLILDNSKFKYVKHTRDVIINAVSRVMDKYLPPVEGDKVIQIGSTAFKYGDKSCFVKHIVTLGTCDDIEGCIVETAETEAEVLIKWAKFIRRLDPDMLTGYNIFGFDYKFMWERAEELGCEHKFSELLSRMKTFTSSFVKQTLSSSGLGDNELSYMYMPGRIQMDLMKIVQRDHKLGSYKLDSVASHFITGNILSIDNYEKSSIVKTNNIIGLNVSNYITFGLMTLNGIEKYNEGEKYLILSLDSKNKSIELNKKLEIDLSKGKYQWGLAKDDVGPSDIFRLQKGTSADRAIIAKYCVQDCELCINLACKLEIVAGNIGMANVCYVPLSFIFLRGQSIKIFSLVSRQCRLDKFLVPLQERAGEEGEEKEGYEGAIVLKPKPGIYLEDPVAVLDYASLYPSSMISENLSHDSIILDPEYDNLPGHEYVDVTYDNYKYVPKGKAFVKVINRDRPTITCRYVQPPKNSDGKVDDKDRAVVPRILIGLLGARKTTRSKINYKSVMLKDGSEVVGFLKDKGENYEVNEFKKEAVVVKKDNVESISDKYSEFQKGVLDGLQLAYKITANSLYGAIGAKISPVYFKDVAASTTAIGRKLLNFAKDFVEENYPGADTVYGDTDSVFIAFYPKDSNGVKLKGKEALKKCIELGIEAGIRSKKLLKHPHDLEYEKTFYPFVLLSKKRYVGNKYEEDPDKYKQTSMGIVLKRRDNAPIVKHVYGGAIDIIMNDRDIHSSIDFLKKESRKLLDGKFPLDQLIITKSLRGYYKDPDRIAHKVLADRMAKRDPGNKPQSNDRIPYVYIEKKFKRGEPVLQGDKVEHPEFIIQNNIRPDYSFYITNQILKPVSQIFALPSVLENLEGYNKPNDHYKVVERRLMREKKDRVKVKDKLQQLRMEDVKNIIFGEILRISENRKNNATEITKWFSIESTKKTEILEVNDSSISSDQSANNSEDEQYDNNDDDAEFEENCIEI